MLIGSLLLAAVTALDPDVLSERAVGHLSVALLLLILQVPLIVWALIGHERERARMDGSYSPAGLDPEAYDRREAL